MIKNKLKFKVDLKKTVLFFYKTRKILFAALFAGLLLIAFNVCYNETYLKISIPETGVIGDDNYTKIEKLKLKEIIGEIEKRENNMEKETIEEYQNPFDLVDKNGAEVLDDERKILPPAMSR